MRNAIKSPAGQGGRAALQLPPWVSIHSPVLNHVADDRVMHHALKHRVVEPRVLDAPQLGRVRRVARLEVKHVRVGRGDARELDELLAHVLQVGFSASVAWSFQKLRHRVS